MDNVNPSLEASYRFRGACRDQVSTFAARLRKKGELPRHPEAPPPPFRDERAFLLWVMEERFYEVYDLVPELADVYTERGNEQKLTQALWLLGISEEIPELVEWRRLIKEREDRLFPKKGS